MPLRHAFLYLCWLPLAAAAAKQPDADAHCAVFAREASFAAAMDAGDAAAFAAHLHPGAVFGVGSAQTLHGREAILAGWAPFLRGEPATLRWRPQHVHIGGEPDLASSHGPYLMQRPGPDGQPEYASGRFASVWKRQPDGQWVVLFDGGEAPQRISAEQAQQVFAALPTSCPYPGASAAPAENVAEGG